MKVRVSEEYIKNWVVDWVKATKKHNVPALSYFPTKPSNVGRCWVLA